jgi:hypothetical protein
MRSVSAAVRAARNSVTSVRVCSVAALSVMGAFPPEVVSGRHYGADLSGVADDEAGARKAGP